MTAVGRWFAGSTILAGDATGLAAAQGKRELHIGQITAL
jgi:hypothetical protein